MEIHVCCRATCQVFPSISHLSQKEKKTLAVCEENRSPKESEIPSSQWSCFSASGPLIFQQEDDLGNSLSLRNHQLHKDSLPHMFLSRSWEGCPPAKKINDNFQNSFLERRVHSLGNKNGLHPKSIQLKQQAVRKSRKWKIQTPFHICNLEMRVCTRMNIIIFIPLHSSNFFKSIMIC